MSGHADVHVISIKPDLGGMAIDGGHEEDHDAPDSEPGEVDYESNLKDAFHAAKQDDEAGFIAAMKAAISACVEKHMSEDDPESEEKEEDY